METITDCVSPRSLLYGKKNLMMYMFTVRWIKRKFPL